MRSTGLVMKQDALRWSALCPNPIMQCFGPEVELQLHTEVEEKRLLKEQLQALEVTTNLTTLATSQGESNGQS